MKPRLLDLFCGAGGCTKGYQRAGFYVVGVDIEPQPNYCGDEFIQADALDWASWHIEAAEFDAVHASPPCPAYSLVSGFQHVAHRHPDLIAPLRDLLDQAPTPRVHRHRLFETRGFFVMQPPHSRHNLRGGKTNCETGAGIARWITGNYADHDDAADAMGIDWMARRELANAIPPAYTEHIGHYLMAEINARQAA